MIKAEMDTVIFCGGAGTRIREFTNEIPKPLICIGNEPILLHLIRLYCQFGFCRFILCLGYKGEMIREYFTSIFRHEETGKDEFDFPDEGFQIKFAYTGVQSETGERLLSIQNEIRGTHFFCTYADGLANINLIDLLDFHIQKRKTATLTAVHPVLPFGIISCNGESEVLSFSESQVCRTGSTVDSLYFQKIFFP